MSIIPYIGTADLFRNYLSTTMFLLINAPRDIFTNEANGKSLGFKGCGGKIMGWGERLTSHKSVVYEIFNWLSKEFKRS